MKQFTTSLHAHVQQHGWPKKIDVEYGLNSWTCHWPGICTTRQWKKRSEKNWGAQHTYMHDFHLNIFIMTWSMNYIESNELSTSFHHQFRCPWTPICFEYTVW
jgi:hypothetical protein